MTAQLREEDLGIYSNTPFLEKVVQALYFVVYILFLNPLAALLTDILYGVLLILLVTSAFRATIDNTLLNLALIIGLFAVFFGWGVLLNKYFLGWFNRIAFGLPVFGKLGGVDRATFFTILETSQNVEFEFREDEEFIKEYNRLDADITEHLLKENYLELTGGTPEDPELDARWKDIWEEQILNVGRGGLTVKDSLSEGNIGSRIIPYTLANSVNVIGPFLKFFQLIMIYSLVRFLNGQIPLLNTIQADVFMMFIITIIWYIFHVFQVSKIELGINFDELPAQTQELFREKFQTFVDRNITPIKITVTNRYYSLVRNYFLRHIMVTLVNGVLALVFVAIIIGIETLRSSPDQQAIFTWYWQLSIGMVVIPIFFVIGFYLISIVIQNFRQVVLVVLTGLLTATLPYAFNYLITGNFPIDDIQVGINSVISGIGVALSTVVIAGIKKIVEKEK